MGSKTGKKCIGSFVSARVVKKSTRMTKMLKMESNTWGKRDHPVEGPGQGDSTGLLEHHSSKECNEQRCLPSAVLDTGRFPKPCWTWHDRSGLPISEGTPRQWRCCSSRRLIRLLTNRGRRPKPAEWSSFLEHLCKEILPPKTTPLQLAGQEDGCLRQTSTH